MRVCVPSDDSKTECQRVFCCAVFAAIVRLKLAQTRLTKLCLLLCLLHTGQCVHRAQGHTRFQSHQDRKQDRPALRTGGLHSFFIPSVCLLLHSFCLVSNQPGLSFAPAERLPLTRHLPSFCPARYPSKQERASLHSTLTHPPTLHNCSLLFAERGHGV